MGRRGRLREGGLDVYWRWWMLYRDLGRGCYCNGDVSYCEGDLGALMGRSVSVWCLLGVVHEQYGW